MDQALLMRADGLARSRRFPNVVALLVARHGRIVFERYYRGYSATAPLDLFSITKSVTSAAFGVALADGNIRSVDQPLGDFLPHGLAGASARVRHLTLRELLTMSSGFPSDPSDVAPAFTVAAHPLQALLARPFTSSQGRFAYDSGSAQLVADVVGRAEGIPEAKLVRARLFGPLGIVDDKSWPSDADGNTWGWGGLRLTARDLAKLGYLYLRGGRWHGKQVLPAAWVRDSTARQVRTPVLAGYGYFWWRTRLANQDGFMAWGAGFQQMLVLPRRDLVVVVGNLGAGNSDDPTPILRLLVQAAH